MTLEDALAATGKKYIKDDIAEIVILQEVGVYRNFGLRRGEIKEFTE